MGACFSRKKGMSRGLAPGHDAVRGDGRLGPPPEPEAPQEETVKEVLSETPRPKAPRPSRDQKEVLGRIDKDGASVDAMDDRSEGGSAVCSVQSEVFSVSTELTGELERPQLSSATPVKCQRKRSSSSGDILLRRPEGMATVASVGCRSGRSSPSPARRRVDIVGAGKPSSLREASSASAARSRSGGVAGSVLCRDPGERSGRRSVSPAKKHTAGGQFRSVSASRASPRRADGGRAVEGGGFGRRRRLVPDIVGNDGGGVAGAATERKESLDNPLVSLECFIFL